MRVIPLTADHDLRAFRSGTNVLDHWFRRHGHRNQWLYGVTYVGVDDDDRVLAYVTVAATAIARGAIADRGPTAWPALLLARMAVAKQFQGRGIGVEFLPCPSSAANDDGAPQRLFLGVEKILDAMG